MLKKITQTLAVTALIISSSSSFALDNPKKALINELLEQTGQSSENMGKQTSDFYLQHMVELLQKTSPNVDSKVFDVLQEVVEEVMDEEFNKKDSLNNLIYPIYDKYLTEADLKALIEFNNSPVGKKVTKVMPKIQQEAMAAGAQWGRTLGPKIQTLLQQKLKEKNLDIQ